MEDLLELLWQHDVRGATRFTVEAFAAQGSFSGTPDS
jgi:hypothetical protein